MLGVVAGVPPGIPTSSSTSSSLASAASSASTAASTPSPPAAAVPVPIPPLLASGVPMRKVSSKKIKGVIVTLSPTAITWPSLKGGRVDISSIRELRLGQSPTEAYDGRRWITIVYVRDKQWKVVHLIAHTDDVYHMWERALHELVSVSSDRVVGGASANGVVLAPSGTTNGHEEGGGGAGKEQAQPHGPAADPDLHFVRQLWPAGVAAVDRATVTSLCAQLGLVVAPTAAAKFEFPLDMAAFRQLIRDIQTRPDLDDLYRALSADSPEGIPRERVHAFLRDTQAGAYASSDTLRESVFERFADAVSGRWNAESLASFLASPDNAPSCDQDMTRPLYEYFIASSHNTYLVAEQWRGQSTVEGYIRVLLSGCRSVEIDVHDGSDGLPVVYHGMTITSSVPIRDVCQAINKYAFVASPYPIIISLEIRCSVEQQDRLAQVLKESFGGRLVEQPLNDIDGTPSPHQLKGRILIKTKPPPTPSSPSRPSLQVPPGLSTSPTLDSLSESTTESDSSFVRFARRISLSAGSATKDGPAPRAARPGSNGLNSTSSSTPSHSRRLAELPVYTSAVKYRGFSKLVTYDRHHMFSVSERTANRILREGQEADWIKHNFTHLTRVYPKGARLTSSNFDPRPYWAAGAQMVAINYQTLDAGSGFNAALFHHGGYVLKPAALRYKTGEGVVRWGVRVKVISAQRLPPLADLYVEASVGEATQRTKAVRAASLGPRWDEVLELDVEAKPSCLGLVLVHLELKSPRGMVAQVTRPLPDMGRGYRYLPLDDRDRARYLFATLFVKVDVVCLSRGGDDALAPPSPRRTPSPRLPPVPLGAGGGVRHGLAAAAAAGAAVATGAVGGAGGSARGAGTETSTSTSTGPETP